MEQDQKSKSLVVKDVASDPGFRHRRYLVLARLLTAALALTMQLVVVHICGMS
jgi:hypothetical protein